MIDDVAGEEAQQEHRDESQGVMPAMGTAANDTALSADLLMRTECR